MVQKTCSKYIREEDFKASFIRFCKEFDIYDFGRTRYNKIKSIMSEQCHIISSIRMWSLIDIIFSPLEDRRILFSFWDEYTGYEFGYDKNTYIDFK